MRDYIYGNEISARYPMVSVSIEEITPEVAAAMLERNVNNRNPKREPIYKAIVDGEWKLNGATIVFSEEGELIDGQNRLMACVKANMPIVTFVVRGIDKDAQITMDMGVKRQVADFLKIRGYTESSNVAAIGSAMYKAETSGIAAAFTKANGSEYTVMSTVNFIDEVYEDRIRPILRPCTRVSNMYKGVSRGAIGVLYDRFRSVDEDDAAEFIKQLLKVSVPCKTMLLLQRKLEVNANNKQGRMPQEIIAALIVKTWNAYMTGEHKAMLRYAAGGSRPEPFPEIFEGWD